MGQANLREVYASWRTRMQSIGVFHEYWLYHTTAKSTSPSRINKFATSECIPAAQCSWAICNVLPIVNVKTTLSNIKDVAQETLNAMGDSEQSCQPVESLWPHLRMYLMQRKGDCQIDGFYKQKRNSFTLSDDPECMPGKHSEDQRSR